MRIAIMGPKEFALWVQSVIKEEHNDAELFLFCYDRYIEVIDFLTENQGNFDGIMFPGHVSYMYAESLIKRGCLWEYIPINTGSFYRALLETNVQGNDIGNISIDTYKKEFIADAYREIGVSCDETRLVFADEFYGDEDYYYYLLDFHRRNYFSGKVKSCVTGISEVWRKLLNDNIPCVRTKPTSHVILDTYNKLYLKHMEQEQGQADIVFIAVHMDFVSYYDVYMGNDYEQMVSKLEVAKQINSFASRINSAVIADSDRDFWILTDRKTVETETNGFENIYLSDLFSSNKKHSISIGIGFGENTGTAKYNAYVGMCRAMKVRDSVGYVVYGEKSIKGPIKIISKHTEEIGDIASIMKKAGLGSTSADRIAAILHRSNKNEFTSKELAAMCNMSKRNMDRIIQKLDEAGLCKTVDEQKSSAAGRPTRVIKFKL